MQERTQFTFYKSFRDATKNLPSDERLTIYEAVIDYALCGAEPDGLSLIAQSLFIAFRPTLDASRKKAESGRDGGKKSASAIVRSKTKSASDGDESKKENKFKKEIEDKGEYKEKGESHSSAPLPEQNIPTEKDVYDYCTSKGYHFNVPKFYQTYFSQGRPCPEWRQKAEKWNQTEYVKPNQIHGSGTANVTAAQMEEDMERTRRFIESMRMEDELHDPDNPDEIDSIEMP